MNEHWKLAPTSCRDGSAYAWMKGRPSGAWEMVGCVCHHNPPVDAMIWPCSDCSVLGPQEDYAEVREYLAEQTARWR